MDTILSAVASFYVFICTHVYMTYKYICLLRHMRSHFCTFCFIRDLDFVVSVFHLLFLYL